MYAILSMVLVGQVVFVVPHQYIIKSICVSQIVERVRMKNNNKIKELAKSNNVSYWMIADELGVHENTIGRLLRKPLDEETYSRLFRTINFIATKKRETR